MAELEGDGVLAEDKDLDKLYGPVGSDTGAEEIAFLRNKVTPFMRPSGYTWCAGLLITSESAFTYILAIIVY